MAHSSAVAEAIRSLDRWQVRLWLRAPDRSNRGGGWSGKGGNHADVGPMVGQVCIGDDPASFYFLRSGRSVVTLAYSQISMWEGLTPP